MRTHYRFMPLILILIAMTAAWCAGETLRIVDYNITSSGGTPRSGLDTILQGIGNESTAGNAQPLDLIAMEEVQNQTTTGGAVATLLNNIYGAGTYSHGALNGDTTGAGTQGVVYNTHTLQLLGESAIGVTSSAGQARQTLRYEFHPIGAVASNVFYIYVSHWKASDDTADANRRAVEAAAIRTDADALGAGAHILYTGDFNVYRSSEPSITDMLAPGNGHANDPVNKIGSWHNNASFISVDTQAPAVSPPSGLTGGGLDDRFDFQLVSDAVMSSADGGLTYDPGTYHTFANNGSVGLNGNINDSSNTSFPTLPNRTNVLNLLTTVSDHLPVVADYNVVVPEPAICAQLLLIAICFRRRRRTSMIRS
jgi:endonuclease/exonuclease/phosphatase family metal-dependent hydrolase